MRPRIILLRPCGDPCRRDPDCLGLADSCWSICCGSTSLGYPLGLPHSLRRPDYDFCGRMVGRLRRDCGQRPDRAGRHPRARAAAGRAPSRRDGRGQPARTDPRAGRPDPVAPAGHRRRRSAGAVRGSGEASQLGRLSQGRLRRSIQSSRIRPSAAISAFTSSRCRCWRSWRDLFLVILFLTAAVTAGVYWARGAIDLRESPPADRPRAAGPSLGAAGVVLPAARFQLLGRPLRAAAAYQWRGIWPALCRPRSCGSRGSGCWLLLSITAAAISLANLGPRGARLPIAAAVAVFGPALLLSLLQPVIERLWVKPDELRVEHPYLQRNITMTRHAYQTRRRGRQALQRERACSRPHRSPMTRRLSITSGCGTRAR